MRVRGLSLALAALVIARADGASAEAVVLKSGERGEMTFGVTSAVGKAEAQIAGNRLLIEVRVADRLPDQPERQARLLCQRHALNLYRRAISQPEAAAFIDRARPMTVARVTLLREESGVAVGPYYDFDMAGVVKCRPL